MRLINLWDVFLLNFVLSMSLIMVKVIYTDYWPWMSCHGLVSTGTALQIPLTTIVKNK